MGTLPIPATFMPGDQLTNAKLNGDLKLSQMSQFQPPRAKMIYTKADSIITGTQPLAPSFDVASTRGSTVFDDAWDGSKLVNSSAANGFQIQIPGKYRVRARWTWQYLSTASAGVRYLGLYMNYNSNFVTVGGNIGAPPSGVFGDINALQWDYCRWINGGPCSASIDITMPLIQGACLQLGIFQNSGVTLPYQNGAQFCWFSCEMEA
jgi:hypothetical protein